MKKKYIDGSNVDPTWLLEYKSKVHYVKGKYEGYVSYMDIIKVASKISVDYDESDTCLIDNGYKCLMFLPKDKHWCVSVFYDTDLNVVEWYFDITKENNITDEKPFFLDMYLDLAVSADGKVTILDEDELGEAFEAGIISSSDVKLAYQTSEEVRNQYINKQNFMVDFFENQLKLLDE